MIGDPTLEDAILDRILHKAHRIALTGDSLRKPRRSPPLADGEGRDRRAPPELHRHFPGKPAALQRDEARSRPACPGPSYGFRGRPPPRHDHGGLTRRHAHATRKTPRGDTPPRPLSFGTLAGVSSERWPPSNRNTRPASSESARIHPARPCPPFQERFRYKV